MIQEDRAEGVLLGLACGDALGRPIEGWSADQIGREYGTLREFVGGGAHNQQPGIVTDDTQLTMVLARSLVECNGFDREDFVDRLVAWYQEQPVGIGATTSEALRRIKEGVQPEKATTQARAAKTPGQKATNRSVMHCTPGNRVY